MKKANEFGLPLLGIFIALGVSFGGYFIGQTMYNAKVALNTATVKGLAEKQVKADHASWNLIFKVSGTNSDNIASLYTQAEQNQKTIIDLLKKNGFDEEEIKIGVINYNNIEFRDDDQNLVDEKHKLIGSISIETNKVELVSTIRSSINKLITKGIDIENKLPKYFFTRLNKIKPDMLKEATQNARIAANEFAKNAGANVGKIRSAKQGGFIIRDAGNTYGDTKKINKNVRIVTTITFYLTD